jgi:hypothetical protein
MQSLSRFSSGLIAVLLALGLVGAGILASGGRMFSPGGLSTRNRHGSTLGGVSSHAELRGKCSACHAGPMSGETMALRCLDCHADVAAQIDSQGPLHGKMSDGMNCRECHTEHKGAHGALTRLDRFDHDHAAFQLTGKHLEVDCQSCHTNGLYQGTPRTCVSCHAEPTVHKGRFGTACSGCHSTTTWSAAAPKGFDHDRAAFKLTGKHRSIDCKSCHINNLYQGTPKTCVSCHAEPAVHKGRFGTTCSECHSTTTWSAAVPKGFDHDRAAFKLTGKHRSVDCKSCHVKTWKGTPATCVSCHAEPTVHKGRFGTTCSECHSTTTWKGATFKHTFPIRHGAKRQASTCATCHANTLNYKEYTCYGCHAHTPEKMARKHRRVANLSNCVRCHATGRERGRDRRRWRTEAPALGADLELCCAGQEAKCSRPGVDSLDRIELPARPGPAARSSRLLLEDVRAALRPPIEKPGEPRAKHPDPVARSVARPFFELPARFSLHRFPGRWDRELADPAAR